MCLYTKGGGCFRMLCETEVFLGLFLAFVQSDKSVQPGSPGDRGAAFHCRQICFTLFHCRPLLPPVKQKEKQVFDVSAGGMSLPALPSAAPALGGCINLLVQ